MAPETTPSVPPDDFVGRVMTSVTRTASPSAARSLVDAVRERSLPGVLGAVVVAAHLALARGRVPAAIRAQALVLVAMVALVAGTGATLAATTAVSVAGPILARSVDPARDDGARPPSATPAPAEIVPVPAVLIPAVVIPADPGPNVVRGDGAPRRAVTRPLATPPPVDRASGHGDAEAARPPDNDDHHEAVDGDDHGADSGSGSDGEDRATDGGHDGDDRATDDAHGGDGDTNDERGDANDEATDDPGGHDSGDGEDDHAGSDDGGDGGDDGAGGGD